MIPHRVEILDMHERSALAFDVIKLLTTEVAHKDTGEEVTEVELEGNFEFAQAERFEYYAVLGEQDNLAGAACTQHDVVGNDSQTIIWQMAVKPEKRGEGYGKLLLQHIASVALRRNDSKVGLDSTEDTFFSKFGFEKANDDPDDMWMSATPSKVLNQ